MTQLRVYMNKQHKEAFHKILLEGGWCASLKHVPRKNAAAFITQFMGEEGGGIQLTCDKDYLYRGGVDKSGFNQELFELPDQFIKDMLSYFKERLGLETWDDILINIALHNIVPVNGYPTLAIGPKSKDTLAQHYQDIMQQEQLTPTRSGKPYQLHTWLTPKEVQAKQVLPIASPDEYLDCRPLPNTEQWRNLQLQGPTLDVIYWWRVPDCIRITRPFFISDEDAKAMIALAEHFHIVPLRSKTPAATYALVLESLCNTLLQRKDTHDNSA